MTARKLPLRGALQSGGRYRIRVVAKRPKHWEKTQQGEGVLSGGRDELCITVLDDKEKGWTAIHEVAHATFPEMDEDGIVRLEANLQMLCKIAPDLWPTEPP